MPSPGRVLLIGACLLSARPEPGDRSAGPRRRTRPAGGRRWRGSTPGSAAGRGRSRISATRSPSASPSGPPCGTTARMPRPRWSERTDSSRSACGRSAGGTGKGRTFGNDGGQTIRWADENVDDLAREAQPGSGADHVRHQRPDRPGAGRIPGQAAGGRPALPGQRDGRDPEHDPAPARPRGEGRRVRRGRTRGGARAGRPARRLPRRDPATPPRRLGRRVGEVPGVRRIRRADPALARRRPPERTGAVPGRLLRGGAEEPRLQPAQLPRPDGLRRGPRGARRAAAGRRAGGRGAAPAVVPPGAAAAAPGGRSDPGRGRRRAPRGGPAREAGRHDPAGRWRLPRDADRRHRHRPRDPARRVGPAATAWCSTAGARSASCSRSGPARA